MDQFSFVKLLGFHIFVCFWPFLDIFRISVNILLLYGVIMSFKITGWIELVVGCFSKVFVSKVSSKICKFILSHIFHQNKYHIQLVQKKHKFIKITDPNYWPGPLLIAKRSQGRPNLTL